MPTMPLPLSEFDYDLPERLIAQASLGQRDQARLLVVDRGKGSFSHHHVRDLPELLSANDLLVFNDTRVVPARLLGHREKTGGQWEGLFLRERDEGVWEMIGQTRGTLQQGEWVTVRRHPNDEAELRLQYVGQLPSRHWLYRPESTGLNTLELLGKFGHVPLPPYIRKGVEEPGDAERYQTVYATRPGAVAAPTAGLHFTSELLARLEQAGMKRASVTLHVGIGTFQPIKAAEVSQHRMHCEWGELTAENVAKIQAASDHRVLAVGTTSVRVLETAGRSMPLAAWSGDTDLFIYPPFEFRLVRSLLTNFHLPRSSLLVLVSAFGGTELIRSAYREAIRREYRFYSYGDAMLIL
jgi:S-adenosylmethionine:tRNA ribosyltransferase-isomerase